MVWGFGTVLFGPSPFAVRGMAGLFMCCTGGAIYALVSANGPPRRAVGIAVMLLLLYYGYTDSWQSAQRDSLMLLPSSAAVLAARRGTAWGAGLLVGCAALFKPGGIAMLLPIFLLLAWEPRRIAVAFATSVVPPLFFFVWIVATGSWDGMREGLLDFNVGYAANYARHSSGKLIVVASGFWNFVAVERPLLFVGLLGVIRSLWRREAWIFGWFAAGLASVAAQASLYPYHLVPLIPPLILGVGVIMDDARVSRLRYVVLASIVGLTSLALSGWVSAAHFRVQQARDLVSQSVYDEEFFSAGEFEAVARKIRDAAPSGERLFLWAADAQLYMLSEQRPASRYGVNFPLIARWGASNKLEDVTRALDQDPPMHVVIRSRDRIPWLHGMRGDSASILKQRPLLLGVFQRHYTQVFSTPHLLLLRRRGLTETPSIEQ